MSLETNNVVGRIAKAIKFKHGVISSDIATKRAAYEQISSDFESEEVAAEIAFLQKYNQDDVAFQGDEAGALDAAEASIQERYNLIQSNATIAVDSLAEMDSQIEQDKAGFEADKTQKADALGVSRDAIEQAFGTVGQFAVPVIAGYTAVTLPVVGN